jgi:hypothetical protein
MFLMASRRARLYTAPDHAGTIVHGDAALKAD